MPKKLNAYDIAKVAHVSPATVSRVLNHKNNVNLVTAQKVEEAVAQLGFEREKDKYATKIIMVNIPNISNIFYANIIEGINAAANANNYQVIINQTQLSDDNIQNFLELVKNLHVYGLVTLTALPNYVLNKLLNIIRVVQCNEFNPDVDLPYVSIDDYAAAKNATNQLIKSGKKNLCIINGPKSFRYSRERERGFIDALKENDLPINPDWLTSIPAVKYEIALPIVSQLLSSQKHPDAFFCASDTIGAAVINSTHKYHLRIPEDIAVVGFDNTVISQILTPSLTTVSQPQFQIGYSAVEMLKTSHQESPHLLLDTEFVVRESI
ncbi:LacI family transcriptional regulator [Periweissella cryptocerci]|uniref:LacI family transcriptional regulator n=1 Tax=Periweissella cryptocerci TaxID=2506420 RepID=A0A4P6YT81_9LACO|nr:LacI family DNA-binding transcriptional regulator [Periweissella cryptocerci]QBO35959.1 LacI family transcriptional regulator [Periweissella cryptocerci]